MQGVISSKQKEFVWTADGKNNGESFKQLLALLLPWHLDPKRTFYIMDNASWHKNKLIKQQIRESGISIMFLPASSSVLNPIEQVWGVFKRRLSRHLAAKNHAQLKDMDYRKTVKEQLTAFSAAMDGSVFSRDCLIHAE